jgi:hypothetical protein
MKELKEQFPVLTEQGSLMNLRRWTQCSSDGKRKLSNGELMQTNEEFEFATGDPQKDCCKKETLVLDWIQTFYSEAIIKRKEVSVRFKNISASDVLFKNEISNEHTPAPLYINPSFTDGTKCTQVCNFLHKFSPLYTNKLTKFSISPLQSH